MAPAASSAALVDRRPVDRTDATAPSTAAAPSRNGAIGDIRVAVAGMTVRSAAASAAAMTATAAPISRDGARNPAGSDERCCRQEECGSEDRRIQRAGAGEHDDGTAGK